MLKFRAAQYEDMTSWRQLYRQYLEFYKTTLTDDQLQTVWDWIFDNRHQLYCHLAMDDTRVVGLVHFREFIRPIKATTGIFMDDLFVDGEYRYRGIARQLIQSVNDFAQSRNISIIRWITDPDNHTAIRIYDELATKTPWVTYDMAVNQRSKLNVD